jgi:adenylate kinase
MGEGSHRIVASCASLPTAPPAAARQLAAAARSAPSVAASWPLVEGLVLLGPPGAGKGTQTRRLTAALGLTPVSTGELLRATVAQGTPLGRSISSYLDRGDLVPDDLVTRMVLERLGSPGVSGFLLDGFPRTVAQAEALDAWLTVRGIRLDAAVRFEVGESELLRRLATRAQEQHRSDDSAETVRHRLQVFARSTQPLVRHYERTGVLIPVDAHGEPNEVFDRILGCLAAVTTRSRVGRRAWPRAVTDEQA